MPQKSYYLYSRPVVLKSSSLSKSPVWEENPELSPYPSIRITQTEAKPLLRHTGEGPAGAKLKTLSKGQFAPTQRLGSASPGA